MAQLSQLLARLPECREVRMSAMGHVLWVCWQGELAPAVGQTLLNYGGMQVGAASEQALWFFFTDDVFLALARLQVWGNFNELSAGIELMPGRLQLGRRQEANVLLDAALQNQEMLVTDKLDVWVHPKSREGKNTLPGISFERHAARQGMAAADWSGMVVDVRMPYASTQSWFAILHPLGSPVDKAFQSGWSAMFKRLETLLQHLKIKSIVHETFVMLALENLLMLRTFLRDYLHSFDKEHSEGGYWPCVCVVADRNNLNFNIDLPKKIGLQWDNLMPDFPYLSYRNAYLLGEGFTVQDLRYTGEQMSVDNWCNVLLDENSLSGRSIPLLMPGQLTAGNGVGCFYCGVHSHEAAQCPTRTSPPSRPAVWDRLAEMDLEAVNEGFRQIEQGLAAKGVAAYAALLAGGDPAATVLEAVLDLNGACQLRNVPRRWLYRSHDPDLEGETPARDDSPAWALLDALASTAPEGLGDLEKRIVQTIARHQRDPRLRMVLAFAQVERGEPGRALDSFREAAALTPSPALQTWNEFLQARLAEEQGQFGSAIEQYAQVWRVMPQWREAKYRGIVCKVKMGFTEPVLDQIVKLVREEPAYFNRVLIDPALERGRLLILSALYDLWEEARKKAEAERVCINDLRARLDAWFPADHPVQLQLGESLGKLEALSNVSNYLAFLKVVEDRPTLEKELDAAIEQQVEDLRNRYKYYLDILQEIRDEASWFPFPTALRDFSREFNAAAGVINRAFACNFREAESFKRVQAETPRLAELLRELRKRLQTLRMVRDGTLFGLTMARTFIWVEAVGLLLCFIGVPVVVFWGDALGLGWLKRILGADQWSIQKVLILIVSVIALGVAALRTTLTFDRKREKLLEQAREQREKAQRVRLEKIKRQRRAEAEKAAREREVMAARAAKK
ncbi:hypothetical protein [Desulfovibrio legallii]|uniref:CCHC-type domain-containing protein n=1 Tax=Desulfovibrio legallii TaxID=571438 RepID=A0A1G7PZ62_9BACT|nr:hypothetical protein [Desulfovibrio legallii]SDF91511.1 hypothetical protein SAMN05192586_11825 [Desulfovibrio legallii]